ncbi:hypothetical protein D9M71_262910 [compost metagenome]
MAAQGISTFTAMKNEQASLLGEWINGLEASGATRNLKDHELQKETLSPAVGDRGA